jgi:hypothetical protein
MLVVVFLAQPGLACGLLVSRPVIARLNWRWKVVAGALSISVLAWLHGALIELPLLGVVRAQVGEPLTLSGIVHATPWRALLASALGGPALAVLWERLATLIDEEPQTLVARRADRLRRLEERLHRIYRWPDTDQITIAAHPVGKVRIGKNIESGQPVDLCLADLARHALVLGTPGSGKTHTLEILGDGFAQSGGSVALIDLKGSDLTGTAAPLANRYGLTLQSLAPASPTTLGLGITGSGTEAANLLSGTWGRGGGGEAYYADVARGVITACTTAIRELHPKRDFDLQEIVDALASPAALRELARQVSGTTAKRLEARAAAMKSDRSAASAVLGAHEKLSSLLAGHYQRFYEPTRAKLDWMEALAGGSVISVCLPSTAATEDTVIVGRWILEQLLQTASRRNALQQDGYVLKPCLVIIDELPALHESDLITTLLLVCRSAGMGIVTGSQLLAVDPLLRGALMSAAIFLIHQVSSADSQILGQALGTEKSDVVTTQLAQTGATGLGSLTPGEGYKLSPNILRELPKTVAVLGLGGGRETQVVRIGCLAQGSGVKASERRLGARTLRRVLSIGGRQSPAMSAIRRFGRRGGKPRLTEVEIFQGLGTPLDSEQLARDAATIDRRLSPQVRLRAEIDASRWRAAREAGQDPNDLDLITGRDLDQSG